MEFLSPSKVKDVIFDAEMSVVAAATTDLASVVSNRVLVTGNTGITSFGTGTVGAYRIVRFSNTPLITHSASIITPYATDIQIVAGAVITLICEGSNVWRVVSLENNDFGSGTRTFLTTPSSANLRAAVTDETGSGALVFGTSPTLTTPALGTPSALVGTNITGTAAGLTAGNVTTNANLTGPVTSVGNATAIADAALSIAKTSGLQAALDSKLASASFTFANLGSKPTTLSGYGITDAVLKTGDTMTGNLLLTGGGTYAEPATIAGILSMDTVGGDFTISSRSNGGSTAIAFRTSASGTGAERMRITSAGRLGIGTTSPNATLGVVGRTMIGNVDVGGVFGVYTASSGNIASFQSNAPAAGEVLIAVNQGGLTVTGTIHGFRSSLSTTGSAQITTQQNGAGSALFEALVLGAGDAISTYSINGGQAWTVGLDNSDADKFKIAASSTLGTTDRFTIDTSGLIGIGTSSPVYLLDVGGSGAGLATINCFGPSSDNNWAGGIRFASNNGTTVTSQIRASTNGMFFDYGGSERMRISSVGNVGIGVSPSAKLHVVDGGTGGDVTVNLNSRVTISGDGVTRWGASANVGILSWDSNLAIAGGQSASDFALWAGGAERIRIKTDGKVGIGTTAPVSKFHTLLTSGEIAVFGSQNLNITAGNFTGIGLGYTEANRAYQKSAIVQAQVGDGAARGTIHILNNGAGDSTAATLADARLSVTYDGKVGIGISAPTNRLHAFFAPTANTSVDDVVKITSKFNAVSGASAAVGSGPAILFSGGIGDNQERDRARIVAVYEGSNVSGLAFHTQNTADIITEKMRIQATTGYVGIGTTSPTAVLDVVGANGDGGLQYRTSIRTVGLGQASGQAAIFWGSGTRLDFTSGGAIPLSIAATTGNVGIGTTSPGAKLDIVGATSDQIRIGTATSEHFRIGRNASTGHLDFYGSQTGYTGYTFGGVDGTRMTILPGGNVGIGTTSPGYKLDVIGNAFIGQHTNNATNVRLDVSSGGSGANSVINLGYYSTFDASIWNIMRIGSDQSFRISNFSAGPEVVAISATSGGNVGIGTTDPRTKLTITDGGSPYSTYTGLMFDIRRNVSNGTADGNVSLRLGNNSNTFDIMYGGTTDRLTFRAGGAADIVTFLNSGNVGIGTTAPAAQLSVSGTGQASSSTFSTASGLGGALLLNDTTDASARGGAVVFSAADFKFAAIKGLLTGGTGNGIGDLAFYTRTAAGDGTLAEKMRINKDGNVGIGTTSPGYRLHIAAPVGDWGQYIAGSSTTSNSYGMLIDAGTNSSDRPLRIRSYAGSQILSVRGDGNVGINTDSPSEKLDVVGNVKISTGSSFYWGDATSQITAANAGAMRFLTGTASEKMRIEGNGNVGIGTTSPTQKLHVDGRIMVTNSGYTANAVGGVFGFYSSSVPQTYIQAPAGGEVVIWDDATAQIAVFRDNGNVGIGTTSPGDKLEVSGNVFANAFNAVGGPSRYNSTGGTYIAGNAGSAYGEIRSYADAGGGARILAINPTGGNVGIGTTSPAHTLDVSGTFRHTGVITNAAGMKTYSVSPAYQGNVNSTYEIMRISRDPLNWSGNSSYEITVNAKSWSSGGKTIWHLTYGYNDTGTLSCVDSRGTSQYRVYLGTAVTVSANLHYRPVLVDIPNYYEVGIEVRFSTTAVSSITAQSQVQFTGTMAVGTGTLYSGDTHLVPNGGNVGIGTTDASTRLRVEKPSQSLGGTTPSGAVVLTNASSGAGALELGVDTSFLGYIQSRNKDSFAVYSLLLNPSGGNVAIGTTAASFTSGTGLEIQRSGITTLRLDNASFNASEFRQTGSELFITSLGSQSTAFGTNNIERMRITSAGNVGIGTTSPNGTLTVFNSATFNVRTSGINVHRPSAYGQYGSMSYDGDTTYFATTYTGGGAGNYGAFVFQAYDSTSTPVERFRIAATTGNVSFSSSTVTAAGNTMWHSGNDGAGSGLDADLLDGLNSASTATASTIVARDGSAQVFGANLCTSVVNGYGLRFWNGDSNYSIYMSDVADGTWGGRVTTETTSDYNMYFRMTSGTNRGFVFENGATSVAGIDGAGNIRATGFVKSKGLADYGNTLGSTLSGRYLIPAGASYVTQTSSVTGAIKIKLPRKSSSAMMKLRVEVYDYSTSTSKSFTISGYPYDAGAGVTQWVNITAEQYGETSPALNVRFGYDGTTECIWIGEVGTVWNYPQVFVTDFMHGYSGHSDTWSANWAITLETSFGTITSGPRQCSVFWNSYNDGAGSTLDADLLDGQQGAWYAPIASPTFTGNVTMPSFTITSDIRLKTDIVAINNASDIIDATQVYQFNKEGRKMYGVIAQEVSKIAPILVQETTIEHEDGNNILSVDIAGYIPLLLQEIKDLRRRLKAGGL